MKGNLKLIIKYYKIHIQLFINYKLYYYLLEKQKNILSTVGFSSSKCNYHDNAITIYDLGGHKQIRDIWKQYFADVMYNYQLFIIYHYISFTLIPITYVMII